MSLSNINLKDYENILIKHNKEYQSILIAISIIKNFIIEKNLILYGGTAIDFALRIKGSFIYPDSSLAVPDYDFYSPNSVVHAYELADILYNANFTAVRVIKALHLGTMRVDIGNNLFLADISYIDQEIFKNIPYIKYNGINITHPDFLRIDIHRDLYLPYSYAPREAIVNRWIKDVKRLELLNIYYPMISMKIHDFEISQFSTKYLSYPLCGFSAYSVLYGEYTKLMEGSGIAKYPVISSVFSIDLNDIVNISTPYKKIELISHDTESSIKKLDISTYTAYEPIIVVDSRIESEDSIIYNTHNSLISYNSLTIDGYDKKIRIANIHQILCHFASCSFVSMSDLVKKEIYKDYYVSLFNMILNLEHSKPNGYNESSIFYPTNEVYGFDNISDSTLILINNCLADMKLAKRYELPNNYIPSKAGNVNREYSYNVIPMMRKTGKIIQ